MIRFGVIGTNWITDRFIEQAQEIKEFSLQAVYSRTEEKARSFANKYDVVHSYSDFTAFTKSNEIDAVYIASPNAFHAEQAIACMKQGKHVLVEKAFASNAKEAKQMIAAAKEYNVVLMEAIKTTLLPNYLAVKENLHKIGKVRRYFASYCQYSSRYDKYKEGTVLNAFRPEFSNGSLMDIGIYCIYPMVELFGEPDNVLANSYQLDSGVDGQGSILFDYKEQGINGMVMYSKITNSYVPSEIQGEDGSILLDNISEPKQVEIRYKDGSVEDITKYQTTNTMYDEAAHFIDLVKSGKRESPINSHYNSLLTIELIEEARKQIGLTFPADD